MKKVFKQLLFGITTIMMATTVHAAENLVTSDGYEVTKEEYAKLIALGFEHEEIMSMSKETFQQYMEFEVGDQKTEEKYYRETVYTDRLRGEVSRVIIDEISKSQFENDVDFVAPYLELNNSSSHETTYKKLTLTITRDASNIKSKTIKGDLVWKYIPSVKSYDVMGLYLPVGAIKKDSQLASSKMTQSEANGIRCLHNGLYVSYTTSYPNTDSAWNIQKISNHIFGSYNGIGITHELRKQIPTCAVDTGLVNNLVTGYETHMHALALAETTTNITANLSYQHASHSVTYSQVAHTYSFSSSGLGGVIQFNSSSTADCFDHMQGVTLSY